MRRSFQLILVAFILLPGVVQAATCSEKGYTVVFINGILNTRLEAEVSKQELRYRLGEQFNSETVTTKLAYNQTHLAGLGDLIEATLPVFNQYDLDTILMQMHTDVTTRKILLVGHSQGGVYANKIYEYLSANGVPAEDMAVYAVGTPDSYVAGGGKYINYDFDTVIYKFGIDKVIKPLKANVTLADFFDTPDLGAVSGQGHSFIDMYLGGFGSRMVREMQEEMLQLKSTEGTATEGCFDPPERTLGYKAAQISFALGDPVAGKIGVGLQVAGKVAVETTKATVASVGAVGNVFGFIGNALGLGKKAPTADAPSVDSKLNKAGFSLVKAIAGSSINLNDLDEINGTSQGGAVALAVQKPDAQKPETDPQPKTDPPVFKSLIPPPPAISGGISPGFGGGGGSPAAAIIADESPDSATSTPSTSTLPVTPAVVSVSSDGVTFTSFNSSPTRITVTFNTPIATSTIFIQGISQQIFDCADTDLSTFCIDFELPLIEPERIYNLVISAATSTSGVVMPENSTHVFMIDTLGPTVDVTDFAANTTLPILRGTTVDSSPGIIVQVLFNAFFYQVNPVVGNWSVVIPAGSELTEGSYEIIASSTDLFGNPPGNVGSGTLIVDITPPNIALIDLKQGDSFASTSPVSVSYIASDAYLVNAACSFDNDTFTDCTTGAVFSTTLAPGAHYFNLLANDTALNHSEMLVRFIVLP